MRLKVATDSIPFGSDINDVIVPEEMRKKWLTGIDYFDNALGGQGMTPGASMLFTGEPGSGKTTLMLLIADSCSRHGVVPVFNTAEESLYQVRATVERLGLKRGFAVGSETCVEDLLKKCDKFRTNDKNKGKPFLLVVDSLQCMDDGHFTTGRITCATAERSLEQMTSWGKENYTNVIAMGQSTKSGQAAGSQKLRHMVDVVAQLGIEKKDKNFLGYRKLEVEKNRYGGQGRRQFLEMTSKGFIVIAAEEEDDG